MVQAGGKRHRTSTWSSCTICRFLRRRWFRSCCSSCLVAPARFSRVLWRGYNFTGLARELFDAPFALRGGGLNKALAACVADQLVWVALKSLLARAQFTAAKRGRAFAVRACVLWVAKEKLIRGFALALVVGGAAVVVGGAAVVVVGAAVVVVVAAVVVVVSSSALSAASPSYDSSSLLLSSLCCWMVNGVVSSFSAVAQKLQTSGQTSVISAGEVLQNPSSSHCSQSACLLAHSNLMVVVVFVVSVAVVPAARRSASATLSITAAPIPSIALLVSSYISSQLRYLYPAPRALSQRDIRRRWR